MSTLSSLDTQQVIFLVILTTSFLLFFTSWIRNDLVAVLIVVSLYATGILTSEQALAGFSSEPAIVVAAVFVLSGALHATGVTDSFGNFIGKVAGGGYVRTVTVLMSAISILSAFTHHVTTTAVMVPVTISVAKKSQIAPSKLLMPLAFAASLGTTLTIIGAPAFLIASSVLQDLGRPPLSVFSIAPIGILLSIAGILFVLTIGRYILPTREGNEEGNEHFRLDQYLTEIVLLEKSSFIGKTVSEFENDKRYSLQVFGWMRNGIRRSKRLEPLQVGDVLLVRTRPEDLIAIRNESAIELNAVQQYKLDKPANAEAPDSGERDQFVQAVVAPRSELVGRTIGEIDVRGRYGTVVIGLWRKRGWLNEELSKIRLRPGDVLVFEGDKESIDRMGHEKAFLLLVPFHANPKIKAKAGLACAIMLATILCAVFSLLSIEMAALTGAALVVLTRCISPLKAYESIDTKIFVFIAGAIPLGRAMEQTGISKLLAGSFVETLQGWEPFWILLVLFACVALITQVMSDAATTALFAPIAGSLAMSLGHRPEAYVVTVAMAAVTAFLTPIGHHGNLLVYGPGGYRFSDFVKVGVPLTFIVAIIVCGVAPLLWSQ